MIHIVVEKVIKLLVYPQITISVVVRKQVKYEYLTEKNALSLSRHLCS